MVGEDVRGMRSWRAVKQTIDTGKIGSLHQINAICGIDFLHIGDTRPLAAPLRQWIESSDIMSTLTGDIMAPTSWRLDPEQMGGDTFFDVGVHLVDLMLWLGNAPPKKVVAFKPDANSTGILNVQAQLTNNVLLSIAFNDHIAGDEFGFYGQGQLTAFGSRGIIKSSWSGPMATEAQQATLEGPNGNDEAIVFESAGESISTSAAFVATVLDGAPNMCTAQDGANVVALIQSAYRSASENCIVTF